MRHAAADSSGVDIRGFFLPRRAAWADIGSVRAVPGRVAGRAFSLPQVTITFRKRPTIPFDEPRASVVVAVGCSFDYVRMCADRLQSVAPSAWASRTDP